MITILTIRKNLGPEENLIQKDTRTPMFIAPLFTIAKTCKQHVTWMDKEDTVKEWNNVIQQPGRTWRLSYQVK